MFAQQMLTVWSWSTLRLHFQGSKRYFLAERARKKNRTQRGKSSELLMKKRKLITRRVSCDRFSPSVGLGTSSSTRSATRPLKNSRCINYAFPGKWEQCCGQSRSSCKLRPGRIRFYFGTCLNGPRADVTRGLSLFITRAPLNCRERWRQTFVQLVLHPERKFGGTIS